MVLRRFSPASYRITDINFSPGPAQVFLQPAEGPCGKYGLYPDEIRTHDIHVDNVIDGHRPPLLSSNLNLPQVEKHQICTKHFALLRMNWQDMASAALNH
jgi:hypothetical protein